MSIRDRARMGAIPLVYLTIDRVAINASVSRRTVRPWIEHGLPYYQAVPHGRVLIRLDDVERFLTRRRAPRPSLDSLVDEVLCAFHRGAKDDR